MVSTFGARDVASRDVTGRLGIPGSADVGHRPVRVGRAGQKTGRVHRVPLVVAGVVVAVSMPAVTVAVVEGRPTDVLGLAMLCPLLLSGAIVAAHRPRLIVSWQLLAAGSGAFVADAWGSLVLHDVLTESTAAWAVVAAWPGWVLSAPGLLGLALLRVPTGRLPSPGWRVVELGGIVGLALMLLAGLFGQWPAHGLAGGLDNPLALPPAADLLPAVFAPGYFLVVVATALGAFSLVVRWRAGDPVDRAGLIWVVAAAVVGAAALAAAGVLQLVAPLPVGTVDLLTAPVVVLLPLALGLAVVRHGVLDVEVALSRTLVYAPLSAGVVLLGVAPVVVLGRLLPPEYGTVPAVAAAALVAAAVEPARARLQRAARRLVYAGATEPFAVVRHLGDRLATIEDVDDLAEALATLLADDLRLPYVEVVLDGAQPRRRGRSAAQVEELVLRHGAEAHGVLRVGGVRLDVPTARLLRHVSQAASLALAAVAATSRLRAASAVAAGVREEERRRLRRDLHDGVGPALTGVGFSLQALRNRLADRGVLDGDDAQLLTTATEQVSQCVDGLRRAVHDLRPPALDELGLTEAVRRQARAVSAGSEVFVDVRGPAPDCVLPAAVEVAAYRVATEGVTNAVRHAAAARVSVDLTLNGGALVITVEDDGPDGVAAESGGAGVGLQAVRERVGELGGSVRLESGPGRTVLRAGLPVVEAGA